MTAIRTVWFNIRSLAAEMLGSYMPAAAYYFCDQSPQTLVEFLPFAVSSSCYYGLHALFFTGFASMRSWLLSTAIWLACGFICLFEPEYCKLALLPAVWGLTVALPCAGGKWGGKNTQGFRKHDIALALRFITPGLVILTLATIESGIPQDRYYIRSGDILYPSGVIRIASHTICGALSGFILFLIRPKKHPAFGKPPLPV